MPILGNPKHERFAQLLSEGLPASRAYSEAGYKPHDGNASALRGNQKVQARLLELQERAAEVTLVTTESLIAEAAAIQAGAMRAGQHSAAVAALTAKAKLAGKWIERTETGSPGEFDRMTDDELAAFVQREAAALAAGQGPVGTTAADGEGSLRGRSSRVH